MIVTCEKQVAVSLENIIFFLETGQLPGWESRSVSLGCNDIKPPGVVVRKIEGERRGVFGDHVIAFGESPKIPRDIPADIVVDGVVRLCTDQQFRGYNFPDSPGSRQPSLVICGVCNEYDCAVRTVSSSS